MDQPMPTRPLGKTGVAVTAFGLGGEGVLRTWGREREALAVLERAFDLGVTYFDCAHAYAGSEGYYGLWYARLSKERRSQVFQASKSAERTRREALQDLDNTLRTMRLDYLDLWQIHDVREAAEIDVLQAPGGALEAVEDARKAGKIRFVGVTGHYDPAIVNLAIQSYPFDTVLMPVNPLEPHHLSFLEHTLPLAIECGMGVIGMKVPCRGYLPRIGVSVQDSIRYALSQPISTAIIGCDSPEQVAENVSFAARSTPMAKEEQAAVLEKTRPYVGDLLFYKKGISYV